MASDFPVFVQLIISGIILKLENTNDVPATTAPAKDFIAGINHTKVL
jgi:hypothetical protein